jgi:6-phosphogluconolactonase
MGGGAQANLGGFPEDSILLDDAFGQTKLLTCIPAAVDAQQANPPHPEDSIVLVGAYDHPELLAHTPAAGDCTKSGVHVLHLSGADGRLTHLTTNAIGPNVAFIVRCPTNPRLLYASTERIDDEGEIITLRMTSDYRLVEESRVKTGGRSTCYLNFSKTKEWMMAVNYWDAKVSMLHLAADGRPGSPRSVLMQPEARYVEEAKPTREEHWKFRQRWPHSHCCVTEPYSGRVHFVVDLGLDRVFAYRVDATSGQLVPKGSVQLPRGKGPRHLLFHPTIRAAYLVNELDSTVSVFRVNIPEAWVSAAHWGVAEVRMEDCATSGAALELVQCLSSLPDTEQGKTTISPQGIWKAASHSSEIRMHPNGKFFVVGNRGHDSIAVYAVHPNTGAATLCEITPSGGECPRNFNWTAGGKYLVVGNQNSSSMCTLGFDAAEGHLKLVHTETGVTSPNYVYPIPCSAMPGLFSADVSVSAA